jgi:histidine triad (HIT) family protein
MEDCAFCKIVAGQAPGEIVYRDDQVTAFRDIHPAAPTHVLIVPAPSPVGGSSYAPSDGVSEFLKENRYNDDHDDESRP